MKVYLSQIEYKYEVEKTFRLFLPFERYDFVGARHFGRPRDTI